MNRRTGHENPRGDDMGKKDLCQRRSEAKNKRKKEKKKGRKAKTKIQKT